MKPLKSRQVSHSGRVAASDLFSFLILLGLVLAVSATLSLRPITDSDFWHHLAFGRIVISEHRIPTGDELSFTATGRPWVSSGWLPSVLLFKTWQSAPDSGPVAIVWAVITVLALFMFFFGSRQTRSPALTGLVCILALGAGFPRFLPRPDVFSVLLIAPLIALLTWYEKGSLRPEPRGLIRAAMLPLLFLLWANCHMLFVIGFAVMSAFIVWALLQVRKGNRHDGRILVIAWLLSGLACLATPYGTKAFWFIVENARLAHTSTRINELKPLLTIFQEPGGSQTLVLFGLWLAFCSWIFIMFRKSVSWWQWMVVALLLGLTLIQRRQMGLAASGISILVLNVMASGSLPAWTKSKWLLIVPATMAALIFAARYNGWFGLPDKRSTAADCEWFPCEAVEFLRNNPPPPGLFHDLYSGGFLAYNLSPQTKVFIDGRLEVYNNGAYDDFFAPSEGRLPLKSVLDKYKVKSVFLDWRAAAQQSGHTAGVLSDQSDWQLCWFSDHYALFVHRDDDTTTYTASHGYQYLNPLRPDRFMAALSNPAESASARAEANRAKQEDPAGHLSGMAMKFAGNGTP